ncbi:WD40 repeat-like protein [Neoconidiobolus thromboides FSU 785]|nr:WD40 repeat-like protein [Neoconidiobolus thromboides FSU 785]
MDFELTIEDSDIETLKFVNQPSNSLLCPVCRDICHEPLITHRCHHSYCAKCIYQSINIEPFCPLCRCRLKSEDLHPNLALASLINELLVYCKNQMYGCTQKIRLDGYKAHIKSCLYTPIECPNKIYGCEFHGTLKEKEEHLRNCEIQKMLPFIKVMENRIKGLEEKVLEQNRELEKVKLILSNKNQNGSVNGVSKKIVEINNGASSSKHNMIEDELIDQPLFPHNDIKLEQNITGHTSGVTSLAYSNGLLFSGSHDGSTKIYDTNNQNQIIWEYNTHSTSVWGLTVFQDEKRFFTASSDKLIKAWDYKEGERSYNPSKVLDQHQGKVYSLLCRFGKLFSGSSDKTVKIWDPRSLNLQATLIGHQDNVNSIVALRNNKLATGSSDKTIKIWDISTSTCVDTIISNDNEILDVTISDDQELLFASTYDASILVYSMSDKKLITTLKGHDWEVWQVVYCKGKLFSGSFDHTIKRWEPRMNRCDMTLYGHKGFVHSLVVGDDKLFSGCADRTIKVWK